MRHLKAGRKLGRNATHRAALRRNLACALFEHGQIVTTVAKAKDLRPFVERLITLAKRQTLHAKRLAVARLHNKEAVRKLFAEIAPRFADRPGGYTRIVKRSVRRLGDAGQTAWLQLLKEGETKEPREVRVPTPKVVAQERPADSTPDASAQSNPPQTGTPSQA